MPKAALSQTLAANLLLTLLSNRLKKQTYMGRLELILSAIPL
jgi:hypothetical protein